MNHPAPSPAGGPPAVAARLRWTRRFVRLLERGLAVFGLVVILYWCLFDVSCVISGSMAPTLQGTNADNGDWVLTEKVTRWWRSPRRWEVVEFTNEEDLQVMKRVVGLPGETISIRGKEILIDDRPVDRPASLRGLTYYAYGNLGDGRAVKCGSGFFLLGDDSRDSQDSRFEGPIPPSHIHGRAWLILSPSHRMGFVNP